MIRKLSFITLIVFCFNLTAYAATPLEWSMSLHLFGKQRMYTQKMSKEILLIAKGVNVERHKLILQKTARVFDRTLQGLINGNQKLHLLKSENPATVQQLNTVSQLWEIFNQHIEEVLAGNTSLEVLEKIANQNMPLLENLNKALNLYETESGMSIKPSQAWTLNLVGKQRMLTQKMIKEFLLVANGIAIEENQDKMNKTMLQFERAVNGLLDGDAELGLLRTKNGALRGKLKSIIKLWKKYKPLLTQSTFSQKELHNLAMKNLKLLREVDNTVKMYISFLN